MIREDIKKRFIISGILPLSIFLIVILAIGILSELGKIDAVNIILIMFYIVSFVFGIMKMRFILHGTLVAWIITLILSIIVGWAFMLAYLVKSLFITLSDGIKLLKMPKS
jgi:hypothetical protein